MIPKELTRVLCVFVLVSLFGCETEDRILYISKPQPSAYVRFANVGSSSIPVDFEMTRPVPDSGFKRLAVADGVITGYLEVEPGEYLLRTRAKGRGWTAWRDVFIGQETVHTVLSGYLPTTTRPIEYIRGDALDPPPTGDDRALVRLHYFCPEGPITNITRTYTVAVLYRHFRYPITTSVEHVRWLAGPPEDIGPFLILDADTGEELFNSGDTGRGCPVQPCGPFEYGKAYTMIIWGWDEAGGFKYTIAENGPPENTPPMLP